MLDGSHYVEWPSQREDIHICTMFEACRSGLRTSDFDHHLRRGVKGELGLLFPLLVYEVELVPVALGFFVKNEECSVLQYIS